MNDSSPKFDRFSRLFWGVTGILALAGTPVWGSSHREAPITAFDHKADITDMYGFVSYSDSETVQNPEKVTFILCVDPLIDPANGPNWAPFDPDIEYAFNIDNNHDAVADVRIIVRFESEFQLPDVYTGLAGFGENGATDPETGVLVVPPQIRSFDDVGLNYRQTYSVQIEGLDRRKNTKTLRNSDSSPFYAVPANAGPRTMEYSSLFDEATYQDLNVDGVSVFAGTVDDPFFIDLGATFDTANFRTLGSGIPGVLTEYEDSAGMNFAGDTVSGFAVNAIAIEIPIEMLTSTGNIEPASSSAAVIGFWTTTSRPKVTVRQEIESTKIKGPFSQVQGTKSKDSFIPVQGTKNKGPFIQVQRFGNPLINELIIGIASKNRFSMDKPSEDSQFANFFLDPPIVQIVEALYGGALDAPEPLRTDLLPLVQYMPPIAPSGTPTGPIADLMRLNTGVPATPLTQAETLGFIVGDTAGYPNGRRLFDDVVDITLRVGIGGVLIPEFNMFPNNSLGDGVNVNDKTFRTSFPYLADCPSGRNRRHLDPGEEFPDGRPIPVE